MAGTRRSPQADAPAARTLLRAIERAFALHAQAQRRIAIALSGGRDSVALLDAIVASNRIDRTKIVVVHVHHGLSPHAQQWAEFCAGLAATHAIAFDLRRVDARAPTGAGVEATARSLRYRALAQAARDFRTDTVVLAHHQDDQAETLLLQLLRGAGVHGLAAMPALRSDDGIHWLRPFLDVPRTAIDAFVRERALAYVEDDSNASPRHRRNALRLDLVPVLREIADGYPATLARAAAHQAEAARLVDDLAALDAAPLVHDGTLDRGGLVALAPHRARNVLRHFLRVNGLRPPSSARLAAMLAQFERARADADLRLTHAGRTLSVAHGRIHVHPCSPPPYAFAWRGELSIELPHGRLGFIDTLEGGLAHDCIGDAWSIRPRQGGERFQPFARRPRRALKAWLQEARMPSWQREALPLVFHRDKLAAVPGVGVDVEFQAALGHPGFALDWQPR